MANFSVPISVIDLNILLSKDEEARFEKFGGLLAKIATPLLSIFKENFIADGGGGMIEVNNLRVVSVTPIAVEKGKIVVNYTLNRFFACAGEELEKQMKETLDFSIDHKNHLLNFTLFELPIN